MAKGIHDPLVIIGSLERGDFVADLNTELARVLKELKEQAGERGRVQGSVTLSFRLTVKGETVDIEGSIDSKTPKKQRGSSTYFITRDGALSDEHPRQMQMFPHALRDEESA